MTVKLTKGNGPAVDLEKVRAQNPSLAKKADKVGVSLSKRNLLGLRAQVILYVDRSGSMSQDYGNGTVQEIVERVLGFALQVDADGQVPVYLWETRLQDVIDVNVNNVGSVRAEMDRRGWGGTTMTNPFRHAIEEAKNSDLPVIAIFVGDGNPTDYDLKALEELIMSTANHPLFIKFLTVRPVPWLQEIDDVPSGAGRSGLFGRKKSRRRIVDNFDTKDVPNPTQLTDLQFAELMTDELDTWIAAATQEGILS